MKITSLQLYRIAPKWMFLKIMTDEGLAGWGEPIIPGRAATVAQAVLEMQEYLIGRDPDQIEDIWQTLYRGSFFRGGPIFMAALAGIDQALWDIKGKRYGLPVHQLLGGPVREKVRIYAWIAGRTPVELQRAASERVAAGYTAIKMDGPLAEPPSLHYVDSHAKVDAIVERVGAVRQAIGPTVDLAVDFHGQAHRAMAKILVRELEPFHLLFIEEPVLVEHNEALREIAAHTTIPLATGERMYSRWEFKHLLQDGYIDIIQPDLSHAGGISEVRRIAAMAEAYDVAVAPHCPYGPIALMASLQVGTVTPNVVIQEQVLDLHDVYQSRYLAYLTDRTAFQFADGYLSIPTGNGLGLEVDESALSEAALRGEQWQVPLLRTEDGVLGEW
jgi:galactonate dehydratase